MNRAATVVSLLIVSSAIYNLILSKGNFPSPTPLADQVIPAVHITSQPLTGLAKSLDIPMGYETDDAELYRPRPSPSEIEKMIVSFDLQNTTVREVLDRSCAHVENWGTRYKWTEDSGAIDIVPKGRRPHDDLILDKKVPRGIYGGTYEQIIESILHKWIDQDPSSRLEETDQGVRFTDGRRTLDFSEESVIGPLGLQSADGKTREYFDKFYLFVLNKDFRQVLNELARRDRSFWMAFNSSGGLNTGLMFNSLKGRARFQADTPFVRRGERRAGKKSG